MTGSSAFAHRGFVLTAFGLVILTLWTLTTARRNVPNDERQWHFNDLKESAARNKQQLARLLLDAPMSR